MLHYYGDQLWAAGTRDQIPALQPPDLAFLKRGQQGEDEEDDDTGDDTDEEEADAEADKVTKKLEDLEISDIEGDAAAEDETSKDTGPEDTRSPQEIMDSLLESSLLQALRTSCSAKKAELPMLSSNFYRLHMVPHSALPLEVKKSSHKKLGKFLASMQARGVLEVKELSKGVESVVRMNWDHELVLRHRVMRVEKHEEEEQEPVPVSERPYEPPTITELLMVTANVSKLFKTANIGKGTALTASDVRKVVVEYVKEQQLQDQQEVRLDSLLADLVLAKGDNGRVKVKWEEVVAGVVGKMSPGYSLQWGDQPPLEFKGRLEPVELTTATRYAACER